MDSSYQYLGTILLNKFESWAARKKHFCEVMLYGDRRAIGFFLKNEYVFIDATSFGHERGAKLMKFHDAELMSKRLPNFDEHRRDRLNLIPFE